MKIGFLLLVALVAGVLIILALRTNTTKPSTDQIKVQLETTEGTMIIQLYGDMPITTSNFRKLVEQGFYDDLIFHRVIPNFMIQGGDPQGNGMGGPGYTIQDEFTHVGGNRNDRGTISMANAGPNTGGSQFFINVADNNFLDTRHPAFGRVISGMDIADKMSNVARNQNDKPLKDVKIIKASIIK